MTFIQTGWYQNSLDGEQPSESVYLRKVAPRFAYTVTIADSDAYVAATARKIIAAQCGPNAAAPETHKEFLSWLNP
jgi:hypothetical protein